MAAADVRRPVSREARNARIAVATLFWLNGTALAATVPRYPEIRENLELSNSFFGLAVGAGPIGALVFAAITASLLRRFSSARVAVWAQVIQICTVGLILIAPHPVVFAGALVAFSAADVNTDVAMNAHGLRVQEEYGRSINNTFHAWWSVGAMSGGLIGSVLAGLRTPLWLHAVVIMTVTLAINVALRRFLLRGPDPGTDSHENDGPRPRGIPRAVWWHVIALGLIAAFAASVEDVGFTWTSLYLHDDLGARGAMVGMGLVSLMAAQMLGRFLGDRLVDRLGHRGAARLGAAVATAGMALALGVPTLPTTLIGLAAAGWGVATIIPSAYYTADRIPGLPHGSGLTFVNWLLRMVFFVGPPLIGRLADVLSFRVAFLVVPASTLLVLVLSGHLSRSHDED